MLRLKSLFAAALLVCGAPLALADAASHKADAERFLKLASADKMTVPVYHQVQQMFAQRFAEAPDAASKRAVLESYQAKANAALDRAVGWEKIKPMMIELYTSQFNEQEMQQLIAFYQSDLGKKVLQSMPMLTAQSAQITQAQLENAVAEVNQLLDQMSAELGVSAQ